MPKPDYNFQASVVVACEGPEDGTLRTGPAGNRRSRDGAKLAHVVADAEYWAEQFGSEETQAHHVILLQNPTRAAVVAALAEAGDFLHQHKDAPAWCGGQINLAFAGHGTEAGELVLVDASISADEITNTIVEHTWTGHEPRLRLSVVLDCCFAGRTLAELILHPFHGLHYLLIDGFAAALHDELAWELEAWGHGALTFTMRNPGNAHVDPNRLARAVENGDLEYLRLALQAFVPNPVTYLTEGDQHSIDLINGHSLQIKGCGTVDVLGQPTSDQLIRAIEEVRARPDIDRLIEL